VEKHRSDLEHKHAREMERLRDASVRLKEEYEHKMELERLTIFLSIAQFTYVTFWDFCLVVFDLCDRLF